MRARIFGVAVVGLVALIAVLTVLVAQTLMGQQAVAETAMNAPNMLAVTGRVGADHSVLYVIETEKRQLAVYTARGGRGIRFIGARRIKYDFELIGYNDATIRRYSVRELKKAFLAQKNKDEDKDRSGRRK
ncbi:MAG: hypothetical protein ACYS47_07810 [Planctomycetota bacterium]